MTELDGTRFAEIPDPFADAAWSPLERVDLRSVPSPPRSSVRALRVSALAVAVLWVTGWPLFFERRSDLPSLSAAELTRGLGVPLAAAVLAFAAAAGAIGRRRALAPPFGAVAAAVLASPVFFAAVTLMTSPAVRDDDFWRHIAGCAALTALLTGGPVVLALCAFRRAFAALAGWRAAALGVASGALAAAAMSITCTIDDGSHVVLGHGAMMGLAAVVGGLLGHRFCRA